MKKLFKTFVALAAVAALGFSFVSCKNNDDDSGSSGGGTIKTPSTDSTKTDTTNTSNVNSKYKVGDVLLNDGTVVSYKEGMTFTDEQKKNAVCVLAYFNDKKEPVGLGVRSGADCEWAKSDTLGYNKKLTDIICTPIGSDAATATFTGDTDGSNNWAYICSLDPEGSANAAENYPAFDYVNKYAAKLGLTGTYVSGWYMPSIAELTYIYRNKTTVNAVLKALGGTQMDYYYWSSSQGSNDYDVAWVLTFSSGYCTESNKRYNCYDTSCGYTRVCCVRAFSN